MESVRKYSHYNRCNLTWLDEIPSEWKIIRAKNIFDSIDIRSESGNEELLSVSEKAGVTPRKQINVTMFKAESYVGYKLCWSGDLVINSLWAWMQGLGFSKHHGIVSSAYGVYRLKKDIREDYKYFDYLLRSSAYLWELRVNSKGIWRSRYQLTDESFFNIPIIVPDDISRKQIIQYLDWKTTQINKLIKAKKRMIELLLEKKQVIINDAVSGKIADFKRNSKSLEPWISTKLKKISSKITDGEHLSPSFTDVGVPFLSAQDIRDREINFDVNKFVSREDAKKMRMRCNPQYNDLLIVSRGATIGRIGLVEADKEFCLLGSVILVKPDKNVNSRFLYYLLSSKGVQERLRLSSQASAQPAIYIIDVAELAVVIPPLNTQSAIVEYIEKKEMPIKVAISKTEREICLISEYKASLIKDVVTGKIDLSDIKIPKENYDLDSEIEVSEEEVEENDDTIEI